MENTVALAAIALAGTICAGFFKLVSKQNTLMNKQTIVHGEIASGLDRLAAAHEKGNRESEERNGHLGEQNIQIAQMVEEVKKSVDGISVQHVDEQKVIHQTVESKE